MRRAVIYHQSKLITSLYFYEVTGELPNLYNRTPSTNIQWRTRRRQNEILTSLRVTEKKARRELKLAV